MKTSRCGHYMILILLLKPHLNYGFLFWPFNFSVGGSSENSQESNSLFGSIFPSITWNRAPIFGFSAYKSIDLGDPGELRNDFSFRIGPKPKLITNGIDETLDDGQNNIHRSNQFVESNIGDRYGRAEHQNYYIKNDIPSYRVFNNNHANNVIEVQKEFLQSPKEKKISPR